MKIRWGLTALGLCGTIMAGNAVAETIEDPLERLDSELWWLADGWENGFPFLNRWSKDMVSFSDEGMDIRLAPTQDGLLSGELRSQAFYGYGCYEIDMKPVKAPGVVSSFFLFAGPYDRPVNGNGIHNEIDIEFLGSNTNMVQLNYWTDDDAYENSHETLIFLDFDASHDFHRYGIAWSETGIEWFIDGRSVLKVRDNRYDPTPKTSSSRLRVMANVWATDPEISNWAGLFDTNSPSEHTAFYKNFRFQPNSNCAE